jgi:hypothetical protein
LQTGGRAHSKAPDIPAMKISTQLGPVTGRRRDTILNMRVINRSPHKMGAVLVLIFTLLTTAVKGDGLDLDFFTKVDSLSHSDRYIWTVVIGLMVINYVLNFIVIGLPVVQKRLASRTKVTLGLIGLTLLGQIADKIGGLLATIVALALQSHTMERDLSASTASAIVLLSNFVFSGIAVALLVLALLKLWSVLPPLSYRIAIAAGIITNPAWSLLILLLNHKPI